LYLLEAVFDVLLDIKLGKGKTVFGHFIHLHNVRRMWVKTAAQDLYGSVPKLESPTRDELIEALDLSTKAITEIFWSAENPEGRIKGFKPHAASLLV